MRHRVIIAAVVLLGLASAAHAQSIAGVVRDESGAVLPGVTVEVSSPALIEKVRSAVTDATGQYRIVSLSPGVYTVTFTLPGFNAVKHDGIELTGTFTATVNADLKVGALEETITVSGTTPLVDVQSVTKQTVITREVIDALPAARNIQAAAVMIPGVTTSGVVGQSGRDVGGSTKLQQPSIVFRGNPNNIQRWDGFHLGNLAGANTGGGHELLRQRRDRPGAVATPRAPTRPRWATPACTSISCPRTAATASAAPCSSTTRTSRGRGATTATG